MPHPVATGQMRSARRRVCLPRDDAAPKRLAPAVRLGQTVAILLHRPPGSHVDHHLAARAKILCRDAADRGRAHRHGRSRNQIQEPHRPDGDGVRRGHRAGRRLHAVEMPVGAGRFLPRQSGRRQGQGAGREFRQCQRLHRQERSRIDADHRRGRRQGRRLRDRRDFSRLDRGDRRAARCRPLRASARRDGRRRPSRGAGRTPARRS